jgi:protein SCO1/2
MLAALVGLLVVLGAGGRGVAPPHARGLHGTRLPPELAGSPAFAFDLPDARGGRVASAALRGRPYALTFLYSRCPDVCPLIGQELKAALRALGSDAARVAVVGVSVDPRGDTPAAVRRWLRRQGQPANFHYAIGTERELRATWAAYFAAPQLSGRPDTSTHTAAVWLVDARGDLRTKYAAGTPMPPADLASDLQALLAEARRAGGTKEPT